MTKKKKVTLTIPQIKSIVSVIDDLECDLSDMLELLSEIQKTGNYSNSIRQFKKDLRGF